MTNSSKNIEKQVEELMMTNSSKNIGKQVEELIEKLINAKHQTFTFLLVGRTGVGKSSTVNSLMGKDVAQVGDYEPTTMTIETYKNDIGGVNFTIIDTPGLCDDLEEEGNDYQYLDLMRSKVDKVDSMWFVTRLDDTRVSSDEKKGIKLISQAFGSKIWSNSVIIFTFANNVNPEKYPEALKRRSELIRNEIAKYSGIAIANNIPSVAVDNKSDITPDGEQWLGELYAQVYARMSAQGAAPFFMATVERIKKSEAEIQIIETPIEVEKIIETPKPIEVDKIVEKVIENHIYICPPPQDSSSYPQQIYRPIQLNERQTQIVEEKTNEVLQFAVKGGMAGAAIGAAFGGVGAVVGGAVGAALGFVGGWFKKKFP